MRPVLLVAILVTGLLAGCSPGPAPTEENASADPSATAEAESGPTTAATERPTDPPLPASVDLGPLPGPIALLKDSTPAQQAVAIAQTIASSGDVSLRALESAFIASGIPVLDANDQPAPGSAKFMGQKLVGPGVHGWVLQVLAAQDALKRPTLSLADVAASLDATAPSLGKLDSGRRLLDDITTGTTSADPSVAFFSNLIVELGKVRDGKNLKLAASPADVQLDQVQVQLIAQRLALDVVLEAHVDPATAVVPHAPDPGGPAPDAVLAVAHPEGAPPRAVLAATDNPCHVSGIDKTAVGLTEELLTKALKGQKVFDKELKGLFSRLKDVEDLKKLGEELGLSEAEIRTIVKSRKLDQFADESKAIVKYAYYLKWAQIVVDVAKLMLSFAFLDIEVSLEEGGMLVRTKQQRPAYGERKTLMARAVTDPGKSDYLNCLRLVVATLGLKLSVPQADPLAKRPVTWQGEKLFPNTVRFYGGDPTRQTTDVNGVTRMGVEGVGQPFPLPRKSRKVDRVGSVFITIAVKDMNLLDAVSDVTSVALSGPLLPIKAALESLYRAKLAGRPGEFPVRDWGQRWNLTMTRREVGRDASFDLTYKAVLDVTGDGQATGTGSAQLAGTGYCDVTKNGKVVRITFSQTGTWAFDMIGEVKDGILEVAMIERDLRFYSDAYSPGSPAARCSWFAMTSVDMELQLIAGGWAPPRTPMRFPAVEGTFMRSVPVDAVHFGGFGEVPFGKFDLKITIDPEE